MTKRAALLWRWPLIASIAASLFYIVWYLLVGTVPILPEIPPPLNKIQTLSLLAQPWIGIPSTAAWAAIVALAYTNKYTDLGDRGTIILFVVVVSLFIGLFLGFLFNSIVGSAYFLFIGLLVGLWGYNGIHLHSNAGFCVGSVIVATKVANFDYAILVFMMFGLTQVIGLCIFKSVNMFLDTSVRHNVAKWITARDVKE